MAGDLLIDGHDRPVRLHGVNRSGSEYACVQGWGVFDGPSGVASVAAMAAWHVNVVRVPLNEDCWLGINGVPARYGGRSYVGAIVRYVGLLHRLGMYAEVSLMWGAPGSARATYQSNAPDEDHAPAVWAGMARAFRGDGGVILAPWGETTVGWRCFRLGCRDQATFGSGPWDGDGRCGGGCFYYTSAGMQQAVDVMRRAGYHGPIAIPCIADANMCGVPAPGQEPYNGSTWVLSRPVDPDHQILAEAHVYGKNSCDTTTCFNSSMLPILRSGYPLIFGEMGETYDGSDCGSSYVSQIAQWAEAHNVGYEAWAWDTSHNCLALIDNYAGSPSRGYGAWIRADLAKAPPSPGGS